MFVFDLTKEKSFLNLAKWMGQMEQNKTCPFVMVGNKSDLLDERMISDEEIDKLNQKCGTQCFLTSALTGEGVEETFFQLINAIAPSKIAEIKEPQMTTKSSL